MAITYNAWENLSHIYQDDDGVFSANRAGDVAFDYFPDDAAVGDCLYWGGPGKFRDIQVCIGTAFAADSVTFEWEYYSGSWDSLTVTDGTNDWTNLGEQEIEFEPPDDWTWHASINGQTNYMWVRCRITAVTNPAEGGANSTQVCQCGDNTILVTGYAEEAECTFTDLYNADVAGSWGRITRQGTAQFRINCYVDIGDGSTETWFADTRKQVLIPDGLICYRSGTVIRVRKEATFTLGTVIDAGDRTTADGCDFLVLETSRYLFAIHGGGVTTDVAGTVRLYSCRFQGTGDVIVYISDGRGWQVYNCVFGRGVFLHLIYYGLFYCLWFESAAGYAISSPTSAVLIGKIYVRDRTNLFYVAGTTITARDVEAINNTYISWIGTNRIAYLYDVTSDVWAFVWYLPTTATVYRYHSLALKVVDEDGDGLAGVTVTIEDKDGTAIAGSPFTTGGSGDVATQDILHGTYEQNDNLVKKSPYTVVMAKAGYTARAIVYTMDRKREEIEMLEAAVAVEIPLTADIEEEALTYSAAVQAITADVVKEAITADVVEDALTYSAAVQAITGDVS